MKISPANLQKLEKLVEDSGYILRYERGSFQSGYCILEHKKVVVLNKFLNVEGRINTLQELIPVLEINIDALTHDNQKLHEELMAVSKQSAS